MSGNIQKNYLNEVQILEHFMEMERRFKRNTDRPFYPSLDYFLDDSKDILDLLRAQAENMVHFVGLGNKPIKIKIEKLNNAVAQISLSDLSFIDITIDEDNYNHFKSNRNYKFERIFAALAHELGHFILKYNGLWFHGFLDIENEIYADLSMFYLGFGKFVLKGFFDGSRAGYLRPETYAMAYVLSEYLNGKDPDTNLLPENIINLIETAKSNCKTKWIKNIKSEEDMKQEYKKLSIHAGTTCTIMSIYESILNQETTSLGNYIKHLNEICLNKAENTPLNYRKASIAYATFLKNDIHNYLGETNLNKWIEMLSYLEIEQQFKFDIIAANITHKCPYCGATINNPAFKTEEGKRIFHIRCNKCQTQFVVDNNIPRILSQIKKHFKKFNNIVPIYKDGPVILKALESLQEKIVSKDRQIASLGQEMKRLKMSEGKLQTEINRLKYDVIKWRSMNWWQRLWHKP